MSDHSEQAKSIFLEAIEKHSPQEWPTFLEEACGGDVAMRASVEKLLRAQAELGSFHEGPRPPVGPTIDLPLAAETLGTVIGPYKLVEQIGEGGMGTVWMAQQTQPVKRVVALKLIKAGMDSKQFIARFEAERQALALMDHPNIARVLDAGTTSAGRPYFAMDLVRGVPITRYCDEHQLTPRQRLELFVSVCQAIQHAHQKGVIHRDLKPSNVLVALYDGQPVPKVIDFGVAKAAVQPLTEQTLVTGFGNIVGTLEYMSPEQAEINQLDIDTRSDVYSLGVLLYELLTGSPPFTRKELERVGMLEMLRLIREQEPSKPSTKLSTAEGLPTLAAKRGTEPVKLTKLVRGELDWIVMKALEKDRNRRYETANGFAMDVQRYLADEPVLACPPSAGYRLRKLMRRNKRIAVMLSAITTAILLGVAALAVSTVLVLRANEDLKKERDRAETEQVNTQAALDLLWQGVLLEASPFREPDPRTSVRTLPDRVAARLEAGSGQPPLVEAAVRQMLARLYLEVGEHGKGLRHAEWALDVHKRELGEKDPRTLASAHTRAAALWRVGNLSEASRVLSRTLELRRDVLGNEDDATLTTMLLTAVVLGQTGQHDEADRLYEEAVDTRTRVFGPSHRETMNARSAQGEHLLARLKLDEAEAVFADCVEQSKALFGERDRLTITALWNLGWVYLHKDDAARAEPVLTSCVEATRQILTDKHPFTLLSIEALAQAYQLQGQYAEAAPLFAEVLDARRRGVRHPRIQGVLEALGENLLEEQKYADAEGHLREWLKARAERQTGSAAHARAQLLLGTSLLGQKKQDEAESLLTEGLQALKKRVDPTNQGTPLHKRRRARDIERVVLLYEQWGQPERAAQWQTEMKK